MLSFFACRGEPPPRDYQNSPPGMTHPVLKKSQTPAQNGMPGPSAEPNSGAEGKAGRKPIDPTQPSTTLKDQSPASATTGTVMTGTSLATKP